MNKIIKDPETGLSVPRTVAAVMEGMMRDASKVANKKATLEMKKIERAIAFLDIADEEGFTSKDIFRNMQDAIDMAKKGGDSRALTRLVEVQCKMLLEVHQSVGDTVLKLTQIQNNMDKSAGGEVPALTGIAFEKAVLEQVEKIVNGG